MESTAHNCFIIQEREVIYFTDAENVLFLPVMPINLIKYILKKKKVKKI